MRFNWNPAVYVLTPFDYQLQWNQQLPLLFQVCTQTLSLPSGVSVISANVAAGHLSSASIYPACFAPYLLVTACTDGQLRFWNCSVKEMAPSHRHESSFNVTSYEYSMSGSSSVRQPSMTSFQQWQPQNQDYEWCEWQMMCAKQGSSAVKISGKYTHCSELFI